MTIKHPYVRHHLQQALLVFADIDYQTEFWVKADRRTMGYAVGFDVESETLLDDVSWEFGEDLIGYVFRNKDELEAALQVCGHVENIIAAIGNYQDDEKYMSHPLWPSVIASARNALRIMNAGDK